MNIVKSTANKVMELEKRLDNALMQESLKVSEFRRMFEGQELGESCEYEILTFFGSEETISAVLQGEVKFNFLSEGEVRATLILDGYEIYSENLTSGSFNVLKALSIAPESEQKLVLKLEVLSGEVNLEGWTFFVWGYGETASLGGETIEPKLYGAESEGRFVLYLILNGRGYVSYFDQFPASLSSDDFSYFGEMSSIASVFKTENELTTLYTFIVTKEGNLLMTTGENMTIDEGEQVLIDEGVNAVTATLVSESGEIVVVYSKGRSLKYFNYVLDTRTESLDIWTFSEDILDVALIQNCSTTTFLAVSLKSGKNYLFSSVTAVATSVKSSNVGLKMDIEFM